MPLQPPQTGWPVSGKYDPQPKNMNLENIIKPQKIPKFSNLRAYPTPAPVLGRNSPTETEYSAPAGPFVACCSLESRFDSFRVDSPCRSSFAKSPPSCSPPNLGRLNPPPPPKSLSLVHGAQSPHDRPRTGKENSRSTLS